MRTVDGGRGTVRFAVRRSRACVCVFQPEQYSAPADRHNRCGIERASSCRRKAESRRTSTSSARRRDTWRVSDLVNIEGVYTHWSVAFEKLDGYRWLVGV